ncbi:MAG: hypothetical protein A2176_10150 [Spirochaetes bacterium RBG_13_51_14]|nr:MAG: hypothetical protein A2176_10150 [Spirochaetes bacterium RBG_13_51_14]
MTNMIPPGAKNKEKAVSTNTETRYSETEVPTNSTERCETMAKVKKICPEQELRDKIAQALLKNGDVADNIEVEFLIKRL